MARTSRKNKKILLPEKTKPLQNSINTGIYARLSVEQEEEDTIQTQIQFLKEYIDTKDELTLKDIYVDHGFSGTTMNRPEFNRMMHDAQKGIIDCIVIKDLSRFGRNFLEVGYYIETILPKINVRLIAVNDNYDSSRNKDHNSLSVPIKNMVNELYAKDISRKICASRETSRNNGDFTIMSSVYGYKVDKEQNQYLVNPETAGVVQLIFRWYLSGIKSHGISNRLNALGIETPYAYKCKNEYKKEYGHAKMWDASKVLTILKNEMYTGNRYLGRRSIALYKNQRKEKWVPRDQWVVYENDHEPLITREDYDKVQEIFKKVPRKGKAIEAYNDPLTPYVYCKHCNLRMSYVRARRSNGSERKESNHFLCKGTSVAGFKNGCRGKIYAEYLNIVVNTQIQAIVSNVIEKNNILKLAIKKQDDTFPVIKYEKQIASTKLKIESISDQIERVYVDFSNGLIDYDDFHDLRERYQDQKKQLEKDTEKCEQKVQEIKDHIESYQTFARRLEDFLDKGTYTESVLAELIDRIDVYDPQKIEIHFKCQDIYKEIIEMLEGNTP